MWATSESTCLPKEEREQQSHEILLRLRNELQEIASRYDANMKLVELPPGPPVIATLTAEVYGRTGQSYDELLAGAEHVRQLLETETLVVDVDDTVEADQKKLVFVLDKEKASLNGINTQQIASTVRLALEGHQPGEETMMTAGQGVLHLRRELNPLRIVLRAPVSERSSQVDLERLTVSSATGDVIQIGEFGHFEEVVEDKTIYHKNLAARGLRLRGNGRAAAGRGRVESAKPIARRSRAAWRRRPLGR